MGRPHSVDRNDEVSATAGGKVAEDPAEGLLHRGTVSVEHLYSDADVAQPAKPFVVYVALDGWRRERARRRLDVETRLRWSEVFRFCGVAEDDSREYGDCRGDCARSVLPRTGAPSLRRAVGPLGATHVSSGRIPSQ